MPQSWTFLPGHYLPPRSRPRWSKERVEIQAQNHRIEAGPFPLWSGEVEEVGLSPRGRGAETPSRLWIIVLLFFKKRKKTHLSLSRTTAGRWSFFFEKLRLPCKTYGEIRSFVNSSHSLPYIKNTASAAFVKSKLKVNSKRAVLGDKTSHSVDFWYNIYFILFITTRAVSVCY